MNRKRYACLFVLLLLVPPCAGSKEDLATKIEGLLVDIADARIENAAIILDDGREEFRAKSKEVGT